MDYTSLMFNLAALGASATALVTSTRLAVRQSRLIKASDHLPVILTNFRDMRTQGFISREFRVREQIGTHDPQLGLAICLNRCVRMRTKYAFFTWI